MPIDRRSFLMTSVGALALAPAAAQQKISGTPTPRTWSGDQLVQYPDPDVVALDNRFRRYMVGNTVIQRLFTGTLWAEGVAWNGVGRYLVWSDIPNNRQMRWIEEDGRVTVFRSPSGFSNGDAAIPVFARKLAPFEIERVAVAEAGWRAEDGDAAVLFDPTHLAVVWNVAPDQIAAHSAPGHTFSPKRSCVEALDHRVPDDVFAEAIVERDDVGVGISDRLIWRPIARRGCAGSCLLCNYRAAQRGCA